MADEELVEGQIVVEGAHHPIAIQPSVDKGKLLWRVGVALGVGVAGDIEPVASPAFAKVRRGEQGFDRRLRIGRLNLFEAWRQACKVVGEPPQ